MILFFIFFIVILSVGTISYPLFFKNLQRYRNNSKIKSNSVNSIFWLSALSDLNEDYKLGRISKSDYLKQKTSMQRNYLNSIE